eukprot:TRINITY_DN67827_c0_g1_i1.p1 TRINITY_DN67827_c0_g1~~TRINITY_DN67827_c0_g1_i1.p1  ORF type:complete len:585 (-),score=42.15 TRINITY_DN67827_c0_g1_i1:286-2040(-)
MRRCRGKGRPIIDPGDFCWSCIPCQHTLTVRYGEEAIHLGRKDAHNVIELARLLDTEIPAFGGDQDHFTWYQRFRREEAKGGAVGSNNGIDEQVYFTFSMQWMAMENSRKEMHLMFYELHSIPERGLSAWLWLPILYWKTWKSSQMFRRLERQMPWHCSRKDAQSDDESTGYVTRRLVTPPVPDHLKEKLLDKARLLHLRALCSDTRYGCVAFHIASRTALFVSHIPDFCIEHFWSIAVAAVTLACGVSSGVARYLLTPSVIITCLALHKFKPIMEGVNEEMRSYVLRDYTVAQNETAERDEELVQMQADHDWAEQVEQHIHANDNSLESAGLASTMAGHQEAEGSAASLEAQPEEMLPPLQESSEQFSAPAHERSCGLESIHLLRFSKGDTERFRDALLNGSELSACRDELANAGHPCVLPSGTFIFVKPDQFEVTRRALVGWELHPFHVVIAESLEYLLDEVLSKFAYRSRPREKRQCREQINYESACFPPSGSSDEGNSQQSEYENTELVIERTFISSVPVLKDSKSVVQSTTEAVEDTSAFHYSSFRGRNPRRHGALLSIDLHAMASMLSWRRAMSFRKG